jgi:uncharacterized membrane protein SpoIIM required for sporulation
MDPEQLLRDRQAAWKRLEGLLSAAERDMRALSPADVAELGRLYRATTSDLALAQRDFPGHRVTLFLNQLVARAHAMVYRSEPAALRRLWHFTTQTYPRLFRRLAPFIAAAALLFFGPALVAGLLLMIQPEAARSVLPADVHDVIPMVERGQLWIDLPPGERPSSASFIMTNNIQVSILAFAGGVLAGLPTAYVLLINGLILGGLLGLTGAYGLGGELASFVVGHGVIELSVICFAGGAGLRLGWAVLRPGLRRRHDALALAGREAVGLLVGCVPLLLVAGLIEGFISPAESLSGGAKAAIGLLTGFLLYAYLLLAGRGPAAKAGASPLAQDNG